MKRNYSVNEVWCLGKITQFKKETLVLEPSTLTGQVLHLPCCMQVCWLCQATKGQDDDLSCCMTDVSPTAGWWQTFLREVPWDSPPSYFNITGFEIGMVVPDLLHCWNLGLARDLLGSALKLILSERLVFNAPCIADRLKLASESLRAFAKQKRYPLRIKKLTKSKLCWQTRKYPSLAASGYDAFVVGVWLEDLLSNHSQTFPEICTMLWAGNRAISLMYSANLFLNEQEKKSLAILGDCLLRTYMSMARIAMENNALLWRVRPKLHMMCHIFRSPRSINQSRYSTWMDEDFLKKIGKTMGLTDCRGSQVRCLQRWLLSIPQHLHPAADSQLRNRAGKLRIGRVAAHGSTFVFLSGLN